MAKTLATIFIVILIYYQSLSLLYSQICQEMKKNYLLEYLGEPVIWGSPILIPQITLRVTERSSSKVITGTKVYLRYMWKEFRLQDNGDTKGRWANAYDIIICTTNEAGIAQFPEYNFIPRGWYDGPKLHNRLPEFTNIEITVEDCDYWITKKQIKKVRDKKLDKQIELKRPDGFVPRIKVDILQY